MKKVFLMAMTLIVCLISFGAELKDKSTSTTKPLITNGMRMATGLSLSPQHAIPSPIDISSSTLNQGNEISNVVPRIFNSLIKRGNHADKDNEGEVIDDNGIIINPPAGQVKYYKRSGKSYYYDANWNFYQGNQNGHVEIVETGDGEIYVKDILAYYAKNSWVKGTKVGNIITIPVGQPLTFDTEYSLTLHLGWGTTENNWAMLDTQNITFNVNDDVITLQGSDADTYIGSFWGGGYNSFSGWGDYNTVWTLDPSYTPASRELVVPPSGLDVANWYCEGTFYQGENFVRSISVALDDNDIYLKGVFTSFPDSWIKGVIDGNTVTFAKNQFLGYMKDGTPIWAAGYDSNGLTDIVFTYDSEANEYDSQTILLSNSSDDQVIYEEAFSDFVFMPKKPEAIFIDDLPYLNNFDTRAKQRCFTVIDSNSDASTWTAGIHSATGTGMFYYSYNTNNNGDDWLISPAIMLEAGKHYRFSLNAWAQNRNNEECLEVMLGHDINAETMTQTIVEPTNINQSVFLSVEEEAQLLENNDFTVEKSGYYYFGIHAISEKDRYFLYVDNFNVGMATTGSSPAPAANVSVTQETGELAAIVNFTAPSTTIDGSPITENLTKINLYRDGGLVASIANVAPGTQQSILDNNDLSMGPHDYHVVAMSNDSEGASSDTVRAFIVLPQSIPVVYDFTTQDFNQSLIIDANGDGRTWSQSATDGATYVFGRINADEYIVMQPAHLQAGISYSITVNACSSGTNMPESIEVLMGKNATIDGLDMVAMETTQVATAENQYQDFTCDINMAETGDYFIALHCVSTINDGFRLNVKKVIVSKNASTNGPGAPTIAVQPNPEGKTQATITVTAPTLRIDSIELTQNMSKIDILRDDNVVYTEFNVQPGASITFTDTTATKGNHTYYAIPYDANGDPGASSEKVTLYVGQDLPKAIYDVRYADNGDGYTLMWDKVDSVGRNNGYVNPALVDYVISANKVSVIAGIEYDDVGDEMGRVRDDDHFTFAGINTDEGEQHLVPYYVRTENIAGSTKDYQKYIITGAPYQLPVAESFKDRTVHMIWDYSDATGIGASSDASDGDGNAAQVGPSGTYGIAKFETGKINFAITANPVLTFDLKKGLTNENELTVYAVMPNGSTIDIQTVTIPANYAKQVVSLNIEALKKARFARIGFTVNFAFPALNHYVLIDNIKIEDNGIVGDVNGDGECTASDVTALYNAILYNDFSKIVNGDQNGDGEITASDVTAVYNIILGIQQ